jgi:murein DD-endopeptidase MepM/ murein hydrolase activator NlpD
VPARRIAILLLTAAIPLALWAASPLITQGASPSSKLDRLQREITATQGKIGRKKSTERVLTTQISEFTAQIGRLQARIGSLQRRQASVEGDLSASRTRLEGTQVQLRAERARLVRLRERLKVVRAGLATRLRELYTAERPDVVTIILEAKGFADLLERGEFLRRVSEQDQQIFRAVAAAKAATERSERRLADLQQRQLALTERIQARRDEIAKIKQGVIETRAGVAKTRAAKYRTLRSVREERHHLEDELGTLKAQSAKIAAQLRRAQAAPGSSSLPPVRQGSGAMIWPVNGPITSPFCESRAWESCHPGIDIGVGSGTPIRAAAAGRVVLMQSEASSGGYGNFTCIQHTATMSSCYAHQSSFATSMGASVSQGQVIGYVGCTGRCYGDHLHFEVRINGSVVNPMGYL